MVQEGRLYGNCGKDEVQFSAVLIVATAPSPEAKLDNLRRGKPSLPLVSILHWSAASALGVPPEQIRLFDVKLTADAALNRSSEKGENGGLLLFDASFTGCALDSVELAPGGVFERRFGQAWQKFAAFPVATLRLLELKGDPRDTAAITRHPPPHLPPGATDSADHAEENQSLEWKDFVWLFPAGGLAVVLLCVTSWQLVRLRRWSKRARDSPRHWRDIAPTTHLQQHQLEAQALPDGPGGGSLASIAHDFDPNSDDGNVFAASAGLEATECLKISEGDLLEVLARGDGWLYGRRSGDGLFGYVPEPCVCWIVGESEASRPPLLVDAPLQVGIRELLTAFGS